MSSSRAEFRRFITASAPLIVTILLHVILIGVAGYFVINEELIGKKKSFEATAVSESVAQKQVEHRLQVARKAGGAATSSPVSAARIFSVAQDSLQLPAMPELPSLGAGGFGAMGFGQGLGAMGAGTGSNTALGSGAGRGSGFMSMSFLGITNQRASKVVFAVDIGGNIMDIRKGGFRAFEIMRTEISRLVSTLPLSAQFNVVFFDENRVLLFADGLQPANSANKNTFFEWIKPINADLQSMGTRSVPATSPRWNPKPAETLKLDPGFRPSAWLNGLHAALEQQPDTVFLITGSAIAGGKEIVISTSEILRKQKELGTFLTALKRDGLDPVAMEAARAKALAKLRSDFEKMNAKLVQQKKDPYIIRDIRRVLDDDFQAALKKAGLSLKIDTAGWTDKAGKPVWNRLSEDKDDGNGTPVAAKTVRVAADFSYAFSHVARLQSGLLREHASLNLFLFVGHEEKTEQAAKDLSALSAKNGGKFNLISTKRLEELVQPSPASS
jgi:hypothetical protein